MNIREAKEQIEHAPINNNMEKVLGKEVTDMINAFRMVPKTVLLNLASSGKAYTKVII